ncbi:MAG: 2-oxoacid:ferredoxin/flavodoxin oxidoreductase subunit gamma family protein [Acidobacteria bacterium OLB17]|nr:MAG: 2-oxoacid:ferredoxin/flavodoxin oxidoreductase subunit gamma family protein [Acidobacteria bacterium OLB17]MCZ2392154.1 2-oxoacid:acceptor oxidoreductase subunit alpha [Acidobacteriota bacterium]
MTNPTSINDFVVRFANVNGTGSASANALFTRSVFRMGVPVTPKNIFPSNIQGLPTWYEVRVSEKGHLGRRDGVDLVVAVNPQSFKKDYASVTPGGYFLYDSSKPLPPGFDRTDIRTIAIPLMQLANAEFTDARQRQLFKNIIYIGALVTLFGIEFPVIEQIIGEQFRGKERLIEPNLKALKIGENWVLDNFDITNFSMRVERRDLLQGKILFNGNSACALGAIYAGATVAAWYPITPSTSVVDAFAKYAAKYRVDPETGKNNYTIVQAEDELAAIGMVMGATWNGARAFTATSGPGVSLMNEFLGLGYFAEIPTVLIDVQRTGPSTGMPTRTQQSDLLLAAYASHGDTKHPLLLPATPKECFEMTAAAFDLTERLQTPVIVVTDLDLGMNDHITDELAWDDSHSADRGKVLSAEQLDVIYTKNTPSSNGHSAADGLTKFNGRYGRYLDIDGDGIPYRTIPGTHVTRGAFTTRGSSRDEYAIYTEDGDAYKRNVDRLALKFDTAKELVPQPEFIAAGTTTVSSDVARSSPDGVIYFGTSTYAAMEAMEMFEADGTHLDAMRPRAFPFGKAFCEFVASHDRIFVVEQNRDAQFRSLMLIELGADPKKLISVLNYDGTPITADNIYAQIRAYL